MRIVLVTIGSYGDVQPMLVLGKALLARGHHVVLATGAKFAEAVEQAGLGFAALSSSGDSAVDLLTNAKVQAALRRSSSMYRMMRAAPRLTSTQRDGLVDEIVAATAGADLIINTTLTRTSTLGQPDVPWCTLAAWPITETGDRPALVAPRLPLGRAYNLFTYRAMDAIEWLVYRSSINRRRAAAGFAPLGRQSPFRDDGVARPVLYQFSPHVMPPAHDWPEHCHVTGYWHDKGDQPRPAQLAKFLRDGPRPLVATFGSSWLAGGPALLSASLSAARQTGHRLVIVGGPDADLSELSGGEVARCERVDYEWLLPHAAAVLHHGGQGTTAAVVRAGVPQVVVPCYADQPMWARQIASLGVSTQPVPFSTLTGDRLAAAVRTAVSDPRITHNAQNLARLVRSDPGVEYAADIVENHARGAVKGALPRSPGARPR